MFILDDLLTLPVRGSLWIFEEIYNAAEAELESEAETVTAQLQRLYVLLETGEITEQEFDRREAELLDRLETIEERGDRIGCEDDEDFIDGEEEFGGGEGSAFVWRGPTFSAGTLP